VLHVMRVECGFLLLAVPPIVLLAALDLAGVALGDSIKIVIWFGAVSLGFWGGLAGVRAGLRGWRLALAVAVGFLIGALVLTLRVILQPGKVVSNSVATISVDETTR
jgi:membrane protease YdiL (CAAX protease family)